MPRVAAREPSPRAKEAPEPQPARSALLTGALDPATALRLQAAAGNRAVAALARQQRTLARYKTKAEKAAADFQAAVGGSDWAEAVGAVGRTDGAPAVVRMPGRPPAEVTSIAAAAKPLTGWRAQRVYRLARFVLN